MKAVIQYVSQASIAVAQQPVAAIGRGYAIFVGIHHQDTQETVRHMAHKITAIRMIPDVNKKIALSIRDIDGHILLVPQFTLIADHTKGHRPNYAAAAKPKQAQILFDSLHEQVKAEHAQTQTGVFAAHMQVSLVNDGPITTVIKI